MSNTFSPKTESVSFGCKRTVRPSKYETVKHENCEYWQRIFNILDENANIPLHRKKAVIKKLFSSESNDRLLAKSVIDILSVNDDERQLPKFCECDLKYLQTPKLSLEKSSEIIQPSSQDSGKSVVDSYSNWNDPPVKSKRLKNVGTINPYLNFFNRPEDRAAIWRPLPQQDLDVIDLSEKAEIIITEIAKDFIEWYNKIYDENERTLDVDAIKNMFYIDYNSEVAKTLYIIMKIMKSIPEEIAKRHCPFKAVRSQLLHEVKNDIRANQSKKLNIAFGKRVPDTTFSTKEDLYKKWLVCDRGTKDVVSMATVWRNIKDLNTTKAFCRYLLQHPEIKPPKYLQDNGFFEEEYLNETMNSTLS